MIGVSQILLQGATRGSARVLTFNHLKFLSGKDEGASFVGVRFSPIKMLETPRQQSSERTARSTASFVSMMLRGTLSPSRGGNLACGGSDQKSQHTLWLHSIMEMLYVQHLKDLLNITPKGEKTPYNVPRRWLEYCPSSFEIVSQSS